MWPITPALRWKKTSSFSIDWCKVELVDLPGTYSLTSYSLEEIFARDFILLSKPDVIVNIVDASNLKRNLYLALKLIEIERPLVLALNMMDAASRRVIHTPGLPCLVKEAWYSYRSHNG